MHVHGHQAAEQRNSVFDFLVCIGIEGETLLVRQPFSRPLLDQDTLFDAHRTFFLTQCRFVAVEFRLNFIDRRSELDRSQTVERDGQQGSSTPAAG